MLAFVGVFDDEAARQLFQQLADFGFLRGKLLGQGECLVLQCRAKGVLHLALGVEHSRLFQVCPDGLGFLNAQRFCLAVCVGHGNRGELVLLDDAEANARVGLDFLLQVERKILIALGRDDGQRIDLETALPLAVLIDAQSQAATDGLPPLPLRAHFPQGTNLEDVRIVPALTQGRVREDELQLRLEAQQLLLVLHDEVVGPFGTVPAGLVALVGVLPFPLFVDGEIAVMDFRRLVRQVDFVEQAAELRLRRCGLVFGLEHLGVFAFGGHAVAVVVAVMLDHVDEKQRREP